MTTFERRIKFTPAFDKRDADPNKNYGIGAVRIWFYLIGPKGAVQWQIGTEWYVRSAQDHLNSLRAGALPSGNPYQPKAWDLGYHSPTPHYDGQTVIDDDCEVIGGPCYCDGSTLNAERLVNPFLEEGETGVWRELEAYYHVVFGESGESEQ